MGDHHTVEVVEQVLLDNLCRYSLALGPRIKLSLFLGDRELQECMPDQSLTACGIWDGAALHRIKGSVLQVVTASEDGTAKLWDTSTGECMQTLAGHGGPGLP